MVSLNTGTPDDFRSITGITKLNNFQLNSAESITCVGARIALTVDKWKTGKACCTL